MLDIGKFISAFFVIMIHKNPISSNYEVLNFYVVDVLARIAVPFFYATAGFLFFRKLI